MTDSDDLLGEFEKARKALAKMGYEWVRGKKVRGRPPIPLKPGQQLFVEKAYGAGKPQGKIATTIRVAPPRVRKHLLTAGLLVERRSTEELEVQLAKAARMYVQEVPVDTIITRLNITTSDLYRVLRQMNIPLRHNMTETRTG
jgi:hypothetical protein